MIVKRSRSLKAESTPLQKLHLQSLRRASSALRRTGCSPAACTLESREGIVKCLGTGDITASGRANPTEDLSVGYNLGNQQTTNLADHPRRKRKLKQFRPVFVISLHYVDIYPHKLRTTIAFASQAKTCCESGRLAWCFACFNAVTP